MIPSAEARRLVDLLPRFLRSWSLGWTGGRALITESGLESPAFFLLRALAEETDPDQPITLAEMEADLFNPYSTHRPLLAHLPSLTGKSYVTSQGGKFVVTPAGRALWHRMEVAKNDYLASLMPVESADLLRLAETLEQIADRLWHAPEPPGNPHGARVRRAPPPPASAPMARLQVAVYALWMARDDAHNAAWREQGFTGPVFDVLTHLWSGAATTADELASQLRDSQPPDDVARHVAALVTTGYVERDGEVLHLTERGQQTRDAIEAETDRVYFQPWPPLSHDEIVWLRTALEAVITTFVPTGT